MGFFVVYMSRERGYHVSHLPLIKEEAEGIRYCQGMRRRYRWPWWILLHDDGRSVEEVARVGTSSA